MKVGPGSIVRVPLGPREVAGIVWDGDGGGVDPRKLRPISQVFDCPPIDHDMRRFVDWIAAYTLSPPGMVARMLLRAPGRLRSRAVRRGAATARGTAGSHDAGARARAGACRRRVGLDALRPRPCGRRFTDRHRRTSRARRVRAGDDPAAAGRRGARSELRAARADRRTAARQPMLCAPPPPPAASA